MPRIRKESGGWNKKKEGVWRRDKKRRRSLEVMTRKRKESLSYDRKRGKSLEVVTRKEEGVWRL